MDLVGVTVSVTGVEKQNLKLKIAEVIMFESAAILNKPITPSLYFVRQLKLDNCRLLNRANTQAVDTDCSKLLYVYNKFDLSSQIIIKRHRRMSMIHDSITARVSTDSTDVEQGTGVLEQEAFHSELPQFDSTNRLEATLNHLSKWLMVALFSLVLILRHDAKAIWIVLGSIVNVGLSVTLKKILNQERPASASKSDPGMPSSHAQSIFFIIFVVILSMTDWLGVNIFTAPLAGVVLAFGSYFAWLRVSQGFHTISQVAVGAVAGSAFSGLWFWLWDAYVLEAFNSSLWIRLLLVVGGVACILRFVLYIIQDWILNEP